jgi:hypothetical protein
VALRRLSGPIDRRADPPAWVVLLVLGALVASRFPALARAPGAIDEAVLAGAVTHFDLFELSPPAPGDPLWILIGRALLPLCVTPFNALATASTFLAAASLPALYVWGRRIVGGWAALGGTALAASLPVVWLNGGRAFADTPGTAFCLLAAAFLALTEERRVFNMTRWREYASARRARLLAVLAGLAAAAGFGVRPRLVLAFGLLFLVAVWRLLARADRLEVAVSFAGAALAGSLAWLAWLTAQAGGLSALGSSFGVRWGPRGDFLAAAGGAGGILDSFLVRDFLSPRHALLFWIVSAVGLRALARRESRAAVDLPVVLVPLAVALWFLPDGTASSRSVPFALVASLLFAVGCEALLRRRGLGFAATLAAAGLSAAASWPEVLRSARETTPPMAAIQELERYVRPERETIVADDSFRAFLRTEAWEGRLAAPAFTTSDFASGFVPTNERLVRLSDFTGDPGPPGGADAGWKAWRWSGPVAEALGGGRLLSVGLRDPAPPLFGPGFGAAEREPGRPAFRWAGSPAHLVVPGLEGPPVALLAGERDADAGPTTLRVSDAASGETVLERSIAPGPFEIAIVPRTVFGPLPQPAAYVISCDRPVPLPSRDGVRRPRVGCFRILDATASVPPEEIWARRDGRYELDVGALSDRRAALQGFHPRERDEKTGLEMRWTSGKASLVFSPVAGFVPQRMVFRVRPPGVSPVPLRIAVGGVPCGEFLVPPGGFVERGIDLPAAARAAFRGVEPLVVDLASPVRVPKGASGEDARPLGVGLSRISFE